MWKSYAKWPSDQNIGTSEDTHDTQAQAQAVCTMLKQKGLGGEGKVFPIAVWITGPAQTPKFKTK